METYKSKPVKVKAELFNPDRIEEYRKMWADIKKYITFNGDEYWLKTLENNVVITEWDYLVIWTQWEFYPCKKDIFEEKYIKD